MVAAAHAAMDDTLVDELQLYRNQQDKYAAL